MKQHDKMLVFWFCKMLPSALSNPISIFVQLCLLSGGPLTWASWAARVALVARGEMGALHTRGRS